MRYGLCSAAAADVPARDTYDLFVQYSGLTHWKFSASVVNLFNRMPPYDWFANNQFSGLPYDPTLYDGRGRYTQVRASYVF